jgi:hypothetical protein
MEHLCEPERRPGSGDRRFDDWALPAPIAGAIF